MLVGLSGHLKKYLLDLYRKWAVVVDPCSPSLCVAIAPLCRVLNFISPIISW